jgi:hypothetical protein
MTITNPPPLLIDGALLDGVLLCPILANCHGSKDSSLIMPSFTVVLLDCLAVVTFQSQYVSTHLFFTRPRSSLLRRVSTAPFGEAEFLLANKSDMG